MLELRNLTRTLGDFVLAGVNLEVGAGEYFILLGPSGVGKTVLLELVAGLLRPSRGAIYWQGRDISRLPPEARGFSLLYQDYALFPHLNVAGNIAYSLRCRGVSRREAQGRVQDLARRLGVTELLDRFPATLSGGEQQRVALARALAPEPALLLLDEPLSALDPNMRLSLRRELKRAHQETGAAFLHVTHDPEEALYLGDRVGVMLERTIRQVGTPEEIFRRPSDLAVGEFLGMKNILPVTTAQAGICRVGAVEFHVAAAGAGTTQLWIKPEEILLSAEPFASSARNQFPGQVVDWEPLGMLLAVQVDLGECRLVSLITHESFSGLDLARGRSIFVTFKSSAVHCF